MASAAPTAEYDAWLSVGERHFESGRFFEAVEAFEKALGAAPDGKRAELQGKISHSLAALGVQYLNAGEGQLAEKTFRRALAQAEGYFAHFGLGYLFLQRADDAEALPHLLEAMKLQPGFAAVHKLVALLEYRQGRTATALSRLGEAARLQPDDAETRDLLARWRKESSFAEKFVERSTAHFRVRLDPDIPATSHEALFAELEAVHAQLGDSLGSWPESEVPVVLFAQKNFYAATGTEHWVGGLYDGQLKLPVAADALGKRQLDPKGSISPDGFQEALRHEYVHVLVRRLAPDCPLWLNEGLAQFFERPESEREARRVAVCRRLYEGRLQRIGLDRLPALSGAFDDVTAARWIYIQSLGFVQFLSHRYKPFRLRLLLGAIREEHSLSRALERTYGQPMQVLEGEWWWEVERVGS
jgi:tetratricopeptide (TPR) repeat protein